MVPSSCTMIVGDMNNVRSEENDANFGIVGWLPSDFDHVDFFMKEAVARGHVDGAASSSSVYSSVGVGWSRRVVGWLDGVVVGVASDAPTHLSPHVDQTAATAAAAVYGGGRRLRTKTSMAAEEIDVGGCVVVGIVQRDGVD
jgi:hypothetical protein